MTAPRNAQQKEAIDALRGVFNSEKLDTTPGASPNPSLASVFASATTHGTQQDALMAQHLLSRAAAAGVSMQPAGGVPGSASDPGGKNAAPKPPQPMGQLTWDGYMENSKHFDTQSLFNEAASILCGGTPQSLIREMRPKCQCIGDCTHRPRKSNLFLCTSHCESMVCLSCIACDDPVICHWCMNPQFRQRCRSYAMGCGH